ncbi:MAG: 2-oxoglutarate ferredoxin oxidoreductase subunit gamma [Clostridia bacterium]|jgi:2-oxoglutarate ferredoxin oxidoreductase subunit gamma|nr:2-oxoglutarate ferredoxin oxidoreductase subunit gamma [Clostridia bacterium]
MERYEIVISGFGGQGVVLGGIILAEAAAIYEDKNATHNQSYGPEARGGASKSEVIISDKTVHYPEIEKPDILVALTQEAVNKFASNLKESSIVLADSSIKEINVANQVKVYSLPIIETAAIEVGSELVTNMVTLGALAAITKVVSKEALEKSMLSRIPKGTEELNLKALAKGFEIGEQVI